jgi:sec-independent protein translocase protein TatC
VVDTAFLRSKRRYAIVLVFIASAVLTPPDAFSMLALAVPAYALYEGSIISVGFIERQRAREEAAKS